MARVEGKSNFPLAKWVLYGALLFGFWLTVAERFDLHTYQTRKIRDRIVDVLVAVGFPRDPEEHARYVVHGTPTRTLVPTRTPTMRWGDGVHDLPTPTVKSLIPKNYTPRRPQRVKQRTYFPFPKSNKSDTRDRDEEDDSIEAEDESSADDFRDESGEDFGDDRERDEPHHEDDPSYDRDDEPGYNADE